MIPGLVPRHSGESFPVCRSQFQGDPAAKNGFPGRSRDGNGHFFLFLFSPSSSGTSGPDCFLFFFVCVEWMFLVL